MFWLVFVTLPQFGSHGTGRVKYYKALLMVDLLHYLIDG